MRKTAIITSVCLLLSMFVNVLPVYAVEDNDAPYNNMSGAIHTSYLAGAIDSTTTYASHIAEYDSFLSAYYDNLTYNFGVNYKSSCG